MSAFGSGPSNGQFWYGSQTNFPGFLYKKNVGVGGRRSTKMGPGGGITCNSSTYLYNKFKPGSGGVGASSIANRRAKNRLATVCTEQKCFPCYNTLGQYSNYTHNPNGFIPCPNNTLSPTPSYSVTGIYTISSNSQYNTIIIFTGDGTITFTNISSVQYILVGGGGGGGGGAPGGAPGGGGGGGGGVSSNFFTPGPNIYNIIVGNGGSGGVAVPTSTNGTNGQNSQISGIVTVLGGNYGHSYQTLSTGGNSGNGGAGGTGNTNPGGNGTNGGGGGGGEYVSSSGGNGATSLISVYTYGTSFGAGGGGGKGDTGVGGAAGNIYAGNGGTTLTENGGNGTANYGGGGGGGATGNGAPGTYGNGGNGGSGISILYFNV
jgi:hypothetical protein